MNELHFLIYGIMVGVCLMSLRTGKKEKRKYQKQEKLPEKCPHCGGGIKNIPSGISKKTGSPYREFWVCENPECSFTCNKKGRHYIFNWDKTEKPKGRTGEEKSNARELETKKEEAENSDEIRVEDIPF